MPPRRRPRTTRGPSRGTSGTPRSRPTAGSARRGGAPRQTRRRTTPTSPPGCPRAGGGRGSSRRSDGSSQPWFQPAHQVGRQGRWSGVGRDFRPTSQPVISRTMGDVSTSSPRPRRPSRPAAKPAGKPSGAAGRQREAARRALAESARTRTARRRRLLMVLAPIGVVAMVLTAFIAVRAGGGNDHSGKKSSAAAAAVVAQVTNVPATTLNAVGAGAGTQNSALTRITGAALTANGKPRVLYIGAEYCPFCAAERWAVIVALSRFGTWSGLEYSYSGPSPEVFPGPATFPLPGPKYPSDVILLPGRQAQTNQQ